MLNSDELKTIPKLEYLLNYISLILEGGDEEGALGSWLTAVDEALDKGEYPQAHRLFQAIRTFNLSAHGLAQIELARADWYEHRGENEEALSSYHKAIRMFRRLGDEPAEALASNSLGLLHQKMSQNDRALTQFHVALRLYRRIGDHKSVGEILSNIGGIADAQKDWSRAIPNYERAIKEFQRVGAKRGLAGALNNLGVASEMLGKFDRAETSYRRCLDLLDEIGQSKSEAGWRILGNLAELYA
jgi:tetratricopeptide (TPR) repeat protein